MGTCLADPACPFPSPCRFHRMAAAVGASMCGVALTGVDAYDDRVLSPNPGRSRLPEDKAERIRAALRRGLSQRAIVRELRTNHETVRRVSAAMGGEVRCACGRPHNHLGQCVARRRRIG